MKRFILCFGVLLLALNANALFNVNDKAIVNLALGQSMPSGGTWAQQYDASSSISLSVETPKNKEHSVGLEFGYDAGHAHKIIKNCKPRILYLAPYFKEIKNVQGIEMYASLGIGIYQRWTPAYTDPNGLKYKSSWSGKLGGNFGFGAIYDLGDSYSLSANLKIHYIRNFVGIGPDMVSATNVTPSLVIHKRFK